MLVCRLVLAHMRGLVHLFRQALLLSPQPGMGTSHTTVTNSPQPPPYPPAPPASSMSGSGPFPCPPPPPPVQAPLAALMHSSLVLSLDTGTRLVGQFEGQLQACAIQLWALMNIHDPKPSRAVKEGLAEYVGRSAKSVNDFYTNWRARHWKRFMQSMGAGQGQ